MSYAMSAWLSSSRAPHGRADTVTARLGAGALAERGYVHAHSPRVLSD